MRTLTVLALLLAGCRSVPVQEGPRAPGTTDAHDAVARRVLETTPLVDGHNDLPWAIRERAMQQDELALGDVASYDLRARTPGHTDIPRLRSGMVGIQFWSVFVPPEAAGAARMQLEQMELARQLFARYPDVFEETLTSAAALSAFGNGRIASVMGIEGGHVLENSLGALRAFHALGARYMTLTHSATTDWADAAGDTPRHGGLNAFGREVVREMNRLGMLVDLSHVTDEAMHDALDVSQAPVIFSHSSARAVTDHLRNVPDEVLRRLRGNGGIVMVTFVPMFVNDEVMAFESQPAAQRTGRPHPRASLADVVRHLEHVRHVAGIDHVGIGGDFDGITRGPVGLEDVSTYPALFAELSRRGWSESELRQLAGENALRVWREAEAVAARLQRERGPSLMTLPAASRGR